MCFLFSHVLWYKRNCMYTNHKPDIFSLWMFSWMYSSLMQGSWRMSLRSSMKNFRRDYPTAVREKQEHQPCLLTSHGVHQSSIQDTALGSAMSEDEYQEALVSLEVEYRKGRKGGRNPGVINDLMEKTRTRRVKWIQEERPLVWEVMEKFPCLASSRMVSHFLSHYQFSFFVTWTYALWSTASTPSTWIFVHSLLF